MELAKRSTMPAGLYPHQGKRHREGAQEQHQQQQYKIEVVGPRVHQHKLKDVGEKQKVERAKALNNNNTR